MKKVKYLLLAFALTFAGAHSSNAAIKTIWSVTKTNGGLFGYDNTHWEKQLGGSNGTQLGWVGVCSEPGWERCKPPKQSTNDGDLNDERAIELLSEDAELRIANGSRAGSLSYTVQVQGESFTRVYTIIWTATEILRRPTEHIGNGQTISMKVTREDAVL